MKNIYLIGLVLLTIASCKKEEEEPTQANITGVVYLYDDANNLIDLDNMQVTVSSDSKSYLDSTDGEGNYTMRNVSFGTYDVKYEKPGYGTFKIFDLRHRNTGGTNVIVPSPSLGQLSSTEVTGIIAIPNGNSVKIALSTSPAGTTTNPRIVRLLFSESVDINNTNFDKFSPKVNVTSSLFEFDLSPDIQDSLDLVSGTTYYIRAYGESHRTNEYFDPDLNRIVFPNLNVNASPGVPFVAP